MPTQTRIVGPGPSERKVITDAGDALTVPAQWALLPPGDAGLTRRVKAAGPSWTVREKKGRKLFSHGVWAPAEHIHRARAVLDAERQTPAYKKKLEAARQRRAKEHAAYVEEFEDEVLRFLAFHPRYAELGHTLAFAVTEHATPVGSGTVARTKRISVDRRAEAAVIAWMRHQTTAYDDLKIARIKGERRRVRRLLAERSRKLLDRYRRGAVDNESSCPLARALQSG